MSREASVAWNGALPREDAGTGALASAARVALLALCIETAFSVGYRSVFLAVGSQRASWAAGLLMVGIAVCVTVLWRRIAALSSRLAQWQPPRYWYAGVFVVGLLLRLAWHFAFHTIPRADGLIYFSEAQHLALEHRYAGAFFPPGLPLAEMPFLLLLGAHFWVAALFTLLCFAALFVAVKGLGQELCESAAAPAIACCLLALWPNDVAAVGVNPKEALLGVTVTAAMWLYLRALRRNQNAWVLAVGALTGYASLTQPAFLLFAAVFVLCELLWRGVTRGGAIRMLLLGLGMVVVVLPWTARNYRVYHRAVLITVNGGSVFYRANNPKANAQYEPEGAEKFSGDEFAASEAGYRAAKLWIREHPLAFSALVVRKQVVYLGDDSDRVYESIKRGQEPKAAVYAGLKLIANGFWLMLALFLAAACRWIVHARSWRIWYALCVLPLLYQWCIDSVFEAGARHHAPYMGTTAVLAALAIVATTDQDPVRAPAAVMTP